MTPISILVLSDDQNAVDALTTSLRVSAAVTGAGATVSGSSPECIVSMQQYQEKAGTTAIYGDAIRNLVKNSTDEHIVRLLCQLYTILGLCGEVGEVAQLFKKSLRDGGGSGGSIDEAHLKKEYGGVFWYLAAAASESDMTLCSIAGVNLQQLQSRKERGTLQGSGDDR